MNEQRLRVLIVNKYARVTGGADRHCVLLTEHLRARGHEVAWLSTAHPDNLEGAGKFIPCSVTGEGRRDLPVGKQVDVAVRAIWNSDAHEAAHELIQGFQPDVIHAHKLYPQLSVAPIIAAVRAKLPIVQTMHDYEFVSASATDASGAAIDSSDDLVAARVLNTACYPLKRRIHARSVVEWIAVSRYVAAAAATKGIVATVLPNFAAPGGGEIAGFERRRGVIFAGRLTALKGSGEVMRLARLIPHVEFIVAGSGPYFDRLSEVENIKCVGQVSSGELARLIGEARVLVVPSLWQDPAPLIALEGLSQGTPVVSYRVGGLPEYVEGSGGGIVVNDVATMRTAVLRLHEDGDLWERLSRAGRVASEGIFSASSAVGQVEAVYRQAVDRTA